jgi:hypothetical protein
VNARALDIGRLVIRHPLFLAATILLAYTQLRRDVWGSMTRVPAADFDNTFALIHALDIPLISVTLALSVILAAASFKLDYASLREGKWVRVFIGAIVIAQAWTCVFQESNLFFDRLHMPDRVLIAALAGACLWRPGFVPLFLGVTMVFMGQTAAILNSLGWTNMRFLLDALMLTSSWVIMRRVFGADSPSLVLSALVVAGATYFVPGLDKLELGPSWTSWLLEDDLGNFFVAAWLNGWVPSMGEDTMITWTQRFSSISLLMGIATLVVEVGSLAMLARPRIAAALLAGGAFLHTGIFLITGILFWKWIVVDIALAVFIWKAGALLLANPWWLRAIGTVAIALGMYTMKPQHLAWWDTRYNQVFLVDVVDDNGDTYAYPPLEFAPYDMTFTQGRYYFITAEPKKTGTFGATSSYSVYSKLQKAKSPADTQKIFRANKGAFDEKQARQFDKFMQRWFTHLNEHDGKRPLRFTPHVPGHIQVFRRADDANVGPTAVKKPIWAGQRVTKVKVRLVESFYDGEKVHYISDKVVREIDIASGESPKTASKKASPAATLERAKSPRRVADPGTDMSFADDCTAGPRTTLAFLGDMKLHKPAADQAMKKGHETLWHGIKDLMGAADVTWANIEGTLACCIDVDEKEQPDPGKTVDGVVYSSSGKGGLNFHPSFAQAMKDAGIDVLSTANNHGLDRGALGIKKTLDVLDAAKLLHAGTRRDDQEPWHAITKEKGFTFTWLACAEWTNKKKDAWKPHILSCTEQRDDVMKQISELSRTPGIDGVIFVPHGGVEDRLLPDERLQDLAYDAAEAGALAVFTSHPHNMQTWEKHTTKDGREVPISWGRGNYITFATGIENVVSTIVYMGVVRAKDGKAKVSGVVHVPIVLTPADANGERTLVAVDRETKLDKQFVDDARQYVLTRFGATRMHPPTLPINTQLYCKTPVPVPARGNVGDVCANDDVCNEGLTCVATSNGHGMCTTPCAPTEGMTVCPPASNGPAMCTPDGHGGHACRRPCRDDDDCTLSTKCEANSYCAIKPDAH